MHTTETEAEQGEGVETGATAPETIEVRRNAGLSGVLVLAAGALAVAFGLRAVDGGGMLAWALFGVMALVGVVHLAGLLDSRAPLLVADDQGVRLREGSAWHGIGWRDVECLEYLPRRGLRDGHLLLLGPDRDQLLVPLTLATRVGGADADSLSDELAGMADGQADVVEVVPGLDEDERDDHDDGSDGPGGDTGGAPAASRDEDTRFMPELREGDQHWSDLTADVPRLPTPREGVTVVTTESSLAGQTAPLADRGRRAVDRVSSLLHRALPHAPRTDGATALDHDPVTETLPEYEELTRTVVAEEVDVEEVDVDEEETHVFGVRVLGAPAADETAHTEVIAPATAAQDAVIGGELRRARERLRLGIDQLSERTRIRPHVLEAMEADDFAACGGDFYARGHLRTISRVLGLESAPLVAAYDETHADAPIDPKRVFESELATGAGGAIRGTRGGRNWSVLIAAVMGAVLIWSVASLVMDDPAPVGDAPVLNQSGGITNQAPAAEAVPVTLTAVGGGAKLVVRDGGGEIVFDGRLAFGQSTQLDVAPPVRISSSDGSVTASLDGAEASRLGETGENVTKTLVP
ncbi:helix-turn-helix domain-containing protein [Nocardioides panacisoli]|uniref:helix-turn-helix domain-containing protein n=1 Tax=Nocardioides panacisoli TaxID=627624 RepID=UPI001C6257F8|nr:helix-turn-helix domain-containing protein [Nocardioides panacisoli]QYJ05313.1 helix-turn-helix domain-containing protein [Nocardioides panacisoli]